MLRGPHSRHAALLAACACLALACGPAGAPDAAGPGVAPDGGGATPAAPTAWAGNLFANPGFEQGREGWSWREQSPHWGDFEIVDAPVRSGRHAVHLALNHGPGLPPRPAKVYGVVQELRTQRFPERLGGWYRVERWDKQAPETSLYLQAVVIVFDAANAGRIVRPEQPMRGLNNYQLRSYIAGLSQPAFLLTNARLRFLTREPPELARWVHFELPVRQAFEEDWGLVPEGFEYLRVLVEARWDNMVPGSAVHADVYYDDLYLDFGPPAALMPAAAR